LGSALARPAKDGRCWNEGLDTNGAITEARLSFASATVSLGRRGPAKIAGYAAREPAVSPL
jgi:hypothetical protein